MPINGVDSRPSLPPQPSSKPAVTGSQSAKSGSSSSSTDSASSPEQAAASSGSARRWNADGFEPAREAGRHPAELAGVPAGLVAALGGLTAGARGVGDPGGLQAGRVRPDQTLGGSRPPPPPQADPATRRRVEAEITRRLGGQGGNARNIADRMARALGNGNLRRGMDILERGLRNNNLNVGLAGINGAFGGARDQATLDGLQRDLGTATGRGLDTVIDNDNGARSANVGAHNPGQLAALRDIANLGAQLGVRVDVASHSNGFNTLRTFLTENPNTRLGNITLVNPNIPPNFRDTQRAFSDMVGRSDRVRLITSIGDGVVPWSGAGRNGRGPVWQQQINAAAAAGVQNITVLSDAGHGVDSVAGQIDRRGRPNLDFVRDPRTGRTEPRDLEAWRRQGYTWSPRNGFRALPPPPRPIPTLGGERAGRLQSQSRPVPTLGMAA